MHSTIIDSENPLIVCNRALTLFSTQVNLPILTPTVYDRGSGSEKAMALIVPMFYLWEALISRLCNTLFTDPDMLLLYVLTV